MFLHFPTKAQYLTFKGVYKIIQILVTIDFAVSIDCDHMNGKVLN